MVFDSVSLSGIDGPGAEGVRAKATGNPLAGFAAPATTWWLSGRFQPDAPVQEVPITTPCFTVGRRSENHLNLSNATVSGRHAELLMTADRLSVRDLHSTNGTFVNGRRIQGLEELGDGDRLQFGTASFAVRRQRELLSGATVNADVAGHALAYVQFDRLLGDPAVVPFFQPIVRLDGGQCSGYEVLARSRILGLETPAEMFRVAMELRSEVALSCLLRHEGMRLARIFGPQVQIYLNTHPSEVGDPALFDSLEKLREDFPESSIVLEIHEAAVTSPALLSKLRERLQALGMWLAYDDFGAGQARLLELADVPPDVIKFDMHLVRGLPEASQEKRQMIGSLVQIARRLGAIPLAEGVESLEETIVCRELGFELAQGYYFGRPVPARGLPQPPPSPRSP